MYKNIVRKNQSVPLNRERKVKYVSKEELSGGTVDWPPKLQTTYQLGCAILAECRQLDTHKRNFSFYVVKIYQNLLVT